MTAAGAVVTMRGTTASMVRTMMIECAWPTRIGDNWLIDKISVFGEFEIVNA